MQYTPQQAAEALQAALTVVVDLQEQADGSVMITGPGGPQVADVLKDMGRGFTCQSPEPFVRLFACVVDATTGKDREMCWGVRGALHLIAKNLEKPAKRLYVAMSNYVGAAL